MFLLKFEGIRVAEMRPNVKFKTKFQMEIVKVIEVLATSEKSFDDAAANAVKEAAKSVKNIRSVYIKEMNAKVENDEIASYGVNAKISFVVDSQKS